MHAPRWQAITAVLLLAAAALASGADAPAPAPPTCTLAASNTSPLVGTTITLAAGCSNNPTSYAWTNCASSTSSCSATSSVPAVATYAVTATNAAGASPPPKAGLVRQMPPVSVTIARTAIAKRRLGRSELRLR